MRTPQQGLPLQGRITIAVLIIVIGIILVTYGMRDGNPAAPASAPPRVPARDLTQIEWVQLPQTEQLARAELAISTLSCPLTVTPSRLVAEMDHNRAMIDAHDSILGLLAYSAYTLGCRAR